MDLKEYRCKNCGGADNFKIEGDTCECKYCGSVVRVDTAQEYMAEVRKVFGAALAEQKEEQVANCRRNLWKTVHAEYVSSDEVLNCVHELKKLLPDDFQANFFEVATSGTPQQLNTFLRGVDIAKNGVYIEDMADYILRNLESSTVLPLKDLITRGLKNEKYTEYITKVEDEAEKLKQGIYHPQVPRDVFLAYSSKDFAKVNEIAEFLEGNKISCFVALRNLRHGRGSVENYLKNLQTAMHNCKCVVFLSSENSRDLDCDALKVELPYIKDNEPNMGRIEYILSDYGSQTSYAAKLILEDFFNGQEYCRTKEDLLKRILRYTTGIKGESAASGEEGKYCVSCGKKNPLAAKRCMECGSAQFASTYEGYLREKLEKEYAQKYQSQPQVGTFNPMGGYNPMDAARRAQAEALRQSEIAAAYGAPVRAAPSNAPKPEFEMVGTTLKKYNGTKTEVVIPQGVTAIADEAFWWCNGIKSITIPNGVTSIGKNAFYNCANLASVEIPNSVTSIGERVFASCQKLTSITIPESVTSMGTQVFANCASLKTINCKAQSKPQKWDSQWIGCNAKPVWNYGNTFELSDSSEPAYPTLENYDRSEFEIEGTILKKYKGKKKEVYIPEGVTEIGERAFVLCKGLAKIIISNRVNSIGEGAFDACSNLKSITVEDGNKFYYSKDNCLIRIFDKALICGCVNSIIPNDGSVTAIESLAFGGCSNLTNITIPNSITSIEALAFADCKGLASMIIPSSVTHISVSAFGGCDNLKTIYCEVKKRPKGWDRQWIKYCKAKVVWGYKG